MFNWIVRNSLHNRLFVLAVAALLIGAAGLLGGTARAAPIEVAAIEVGPPPARRGRLAALRRSA